MLPERLSDAMKWNLKAYERWSAASGEGVLGGTEEQFIVEPRRRGSGGSAGGEQCRQARRAVGDRLGGKEKKKRGIV